MERVERGEDAEVVSGALADLAGATDSRARTPWVPPTQSDLPAEPAGEVRERTPADGNRVLQDLRMFHTHGLRPQGAADAAGTAPLPALLHPYRDLSRVRYEFPVVLNGTKTAAAVRSLTAIVDEVIAAAAEPGDAGLPLRHAVLRLESIMRSLVESRDGDRLSLVWDRAAATLFETTRLPDDKAAELRATIASAQRALACDGELISCGPHTPAKIFAACASAQWTELCASWRVDLDTLIRRLEDILAADFGRSDEAMKPEHLRETLGTSDDMDVQAMSSLLRSAPHGGGLTDARRARLLDTIATLRAMRPVFAAPGGDAAPAPIRHDAVFNDCASARAEHARRMQATTTFFKAVRIARLEIQNQYRDAVHDSFFGRFGERHLTPDEVALCPPVLVRMTDDSLARDGAGDTFAVLNSTAGIKILLELTHLYDVAADASHPPVSIAWPARLAAMALGMHHAYVAQVPASRAAVLCARFLDGLRQPGPALYCIGVPERTGLAPYLAAAAATESRLLPIFAFDPSQGATLAERTTLLDNPQNERTWPVEHFAYRNAAGEEAVLDLAFTPADFMFGDPRLVQHFWSVPAAWWHDAMLPLHEMLELPVNEAAGRIPYILTVDRDNHIRRVVVSRAVVDLSRHCRASWLGVRESGGVENSFAARQLAAERSTIAGEKEREIEAIEKNYVAQLEQDIGELTREIVQRIAGQLMGTEGTVVALPAAVPAPLREAAAPAQAQAQAAPVAAPEEEEKIALDDAYIDTPMCTSCNECTQLNARIFAYNANKQAEVKDAAAGPFSDLVRAAELCPVHIIHPGKPKNPDEPGLDEWIKRAQRYN